MKLAENLDRLPRERDDVLLLHLHAMRRHSPLGHIEIELSPLGLSQLAWANKEEGRQAERASGNRRA